ncbi:MAG: hypothetical protein PSV13_20145 [Lacunisphaera sp.]|nr:hypothetical protein [Lacunisphaera sp.]
MPTFAEAYCNRTGCPPENFSRSVFWRTLHWHALPFAPFLLLGDYFESDRSLIAACGRASRMREVYDETRDFPYNPQNSSWLHRHANLRVSTQRLRDLAALYLATAPAAALPHTQPTEPHSF